MSKTRLMSSSPTSFANWLKCVVTPGRSRAEFEEGLLREIRGRDDEEKRALILEVTQELFGLSGPTRDPWIEGRLDLFVALLLFGTQSSNDPECRERQSAVQAVYADGAASITPTRPWPGTQQEAKAAVDSVKRWVRFCAQPVTVEAERRASGDNSGKGLLQVVYELAPGLDLQVHLMLASAFLAALRHPRPTAPGRRVAERRSSPPKRDWYIGRALVRLQERYASSLAGLLLAEERHEPRPWWRAMWRNSLVAQFLFAPGVWALLRVVVALAVGTHAAHALSGTESWSTSYAAWVGGGVLSAQVATYLLRVSYEPTWLAAAPYRQSVLLVFGFAPMLLGEVPKVLTEVSQGALWGVAGVLIFASFLLVIVEVNAARGFRFRSRCWWPPGEWHDTFASGRPLAWSIWRAAFRETLWTMLGRSLFVAWAFSAWLFATDPPVALVTATATLAVFLALALQHFWSDATLGKSIEVPE